MGGKPTAISFVPAGNGRASTPLGRILSRVLALREVCADDLAHLFLRVAHHDMCIVDAGHAALNEDEVERSVDADDFKVLRSRAVPAHTPCHLLSGPDSAWVLKELLTKFEGVFEINDHEPDDRQ